MKSPIFIAAINMPGHTGGYAFVYDPRQLGGYRTVSTHYCSSTTMVRSTHVALRNTDATASASTFSQPNFTKAMKVRCSSNLMESRPVG